MTSEVISLELYKIFELKIWEIIKKQKKTTQKSLQFAELFYYNIKQLPVLGSYKGGRYSEQPYGVPIGWLGSAEQFIN